MNDQEYEALAAKLNAAQLENIARMQEAHLAAMKEIVAPLLDAMKPEVAEVDPNAAVKARKNMRDGFAVHALHTMKLPMVCTQRDGELVAMSAYTIADAMMIVRDQPAA